jgi:hypothetical protein
MVKLPSQKPSIIDAYGLKKMAFSARLFLGRPETGSVTAVNTNRFAIKALLVRNVVC